MKTLILPLVFGLALSHVVFGQSATQPPAPGAVQSASAAPVRQRIQRPNKKQIAHPKKTPVEQSPQPAVRRHGQAPVVAKTKHHQPAVSFSDARQRCQRQMHNRVWWKTHYTTIVFVIGAYYYYDAGYWFPAWGYDPLYNNYDYDGPIYTYGNLLPDQVIRNVQRALKELGYYAGELTGSLSKATRAALTTFQENNGLEVTGAIDAPTVEALGLVTGD